MNGVNALTEDQQRARVAFCIMGQLVKQTRESPSYHIQEGLPKLFHEMSEWAWRGDATGELTQAMQQALCSMPDVSSGTARTRKLPEYHRYVGLQMVRALWRDHQSQNFKLD
jgi:hypothetical protein